MDSGRVTGRFSGGRRRFACLVCGVAALLAATAGGALASGMGDVVQPSGSVAGQAYPFWLQQVWKFYFTSPAPGPGHCQTIKVGGRSAVLVEDIRGGSSTCHVHAGEPIFVNELSTECSSIPGHHNGWGTSDADLQKCSRAVTEKALISEFLDNKRVPNFGKIFWKQVTAFSVTVPAGRFKGFQGHARAAAWGWALLLRKLPKGTHKIRCKARYPNGKPEFSSSVTLKVG